MLIYIYYLLYMMIIKTISLIGIKLSQEQYVIINDHEK